MPLLAEAGRGRCIGCNNSRFRRYAGVLGQSGRTIAHYRASRTTSHDALIATEADFRLLAFVGIPRGGVGGLLIKSVKNLYIHISIRANFARKQLFSVKFDTLIPPTQLPCLIALD
jgi:hypothetical protein